MRLFNSHRTVVQVVSCVMFALAACSDDSSPTVPNPGQMMPPATAAGSSAAGTPAAGMGAAGMAAAGTTGAAGRSGIAGSMGMAGAVAMAGSGADDDDAGMMDPADAGMMMPPSDAGMMMPPTRADLGKGDGSDVITIGDSWMNLGTTGIQQSLVRVSGQRYRTYGRGGTRLLNEQIPNQYATAKRADPDIKTVVMTGGGNDIIQVPGLRADCDAGGDMCGMVVGSILDRLTSLWDEMSADGVQDVIYVQYSNPEGQNVDFSLPDGDGVKKRCEEAKAPLRCHRLETLDIVMGDIPDTIHPSAAAYDRIGKAVFDLMTKEGMRR